MIRLVDGEEVALTEEEIAEVLQLRAADREANLVPAAVTRAQALMALYNVDLLDEVEAALVTHPYPPVRIWFNNAMNWERSHVYLQAVATELGLSDEQVDDLFRAAALLTA